MSDHKPGCTGKHRFEGFIEARGAAKRLKKRDDGGHLHAYHCKHCNAFHVGENRTHGKRDQRKAAKEGA